VNPKNARQVDPEEVFRLAEVFRESTGTLENAKPRQYIPITVNAAFTAELYVKCLLAIDKNGACPSGHDLKLLFDNLSRTFKAKIRKRHELLAPHDDSIRFFSFLWGSELNLDLLLDLNGKTFEKVRYSYENNSALFPFGLRTFTICLRDEILSRHPEWEAACSGEPTSPDR
jgi:hypothetical protein